MHPNSLTAYDATSTERATIEQEIMRLFGRDNTPRTDRQIQRDIGHFDKVNPRVTELVGEGLLHEVGSVRCEYTGKTVRVVKRFL